MHITKPRLGSSVNLFERKKLLDARGNIDADELLRRAEIEQKVNEKGPLGAFLNRLAMISPTLGPGSSKKEVDIWAKESAAAVLRTDIGRGVARIAIQPVFPSMLASRTPAFEHYASKLSGEVDRLQTKNNRQNNSPNSLARVDYLAPVLSQDCLHRGDLDRAKPWVEKAVDDIDVHSESTATVLVTDQVTFAEIRAADIAADPLFQHFTGNVALRDIGNELMVLSDIDEKGSLRWSRSMANGHVH